MLDISKTLIPQSKKDVNIVVLCTYEKGQRLSQEKGHESYHRKRDMKVITSKGTWRLSQENGHEGYHRKRDMNIITGKGAWKLSQENGHEGYHKK